MHPFTGPWRIDVSFLGASYVLKFATNPKHQDKRHALALSPYKPELIPFEPVDGTDNQGWQQ
jgi:hypothetical protein